MAPFWNYASFSFFRPAVSRYCMVLDKESQQVFEIDFRTYSVLRVQQRTKRHLIYAYQLHLTMSKRWYYCTGKEVMSYDNYYIKYFRP